MTNHVTAKATIKLRKMHTGLFANSDNISVIMEKRLTRNKSLTDKTGSKDIKMYCKIIQ
jgi:hypothetical protein